LAANGPHVGGVRIRLLLEDFRRHIVGSTTRRLCRVLIGLQLLGQTKVGNLESHTPVVLFEVKVFDIRVELLLGNRLIPQLVKVADHVRQLQIAMHHIVWLDCWQALNNLSDDNAGLLLWQPSSPYFKVIFEVIPVAKLELQVKCALRFCHVAQGHDWWRLEHALNLDFVYNVLVSFWVLSHLFGDTLNCGDVSPILLVLSIVNLSESTLTEFVLAGLVHDHFVFLSLVI